MNSEHMQEAIEEMRKEIARLRASIDRIARNVEPGRSGGKIDSSQLERSLIELGGWLASAVETFGGLSFYLSEPGLRRANGFLKQQMDFPPHSSRLGIPK